MMLAALLLPLAVMAGEPATRPNPLATLRAGHPRLMLLDADLERIRGYVKDNATARTWHERLVAERTKLLTAPSTKYEIIGPRLLGASRSVLGRVQILGLLYRLDHDDAAGKRAVKEMVDAAAWPQWNPTHFLDVAELNCAFGLGWDWLQPAMTDADRDAILAGWLAKGIQPALTAYRDNTKNGWWYRVDHNWNQVCNGGNTVAALALADIKPAEAQEIVTAALAGVPRALHSYAPDGGWAEGPGYWHYATTYTVYLLSALDTALGTDFGLSKLPGMDLAGDFRMDFVGPSGEVFNYADAGSGAGSAPCLFWLSRRYDKPLYAWQERAMSRGEAVDLAWFDPRGEDPAHAGVPLDQKFDGVQVGFMRGSWTDPQATWVAFKGGDNRANHSHLDLGCFVLDALGQRWILDLGSDDYNLPGYFGAQRWSYYRLRTEGHDTPLIDRANQQASAKARIVRWSSTPELARGVVDLTQAWPDCTRVQRGVALLNRRDVLVQDEIEAKQPVEVTLGLPTRAKVTVGHATATLELKGQRLFARLLEPAGATWSVDALHAEPPQHSLDGFTRLTAHLPGKTASTRLVVLFTTAADAPAPAVVPLADWR